MVLQYRFNGEEHTVHPAKPVLLVVDDDKFVLETLTRLLTYFGFEVIAHDDSVKALAELHQRNDLAVLVCDYEMPEVNGEELARVAKQRTPGMPVFILSGTHPPARDVTAWDAWFLKGAPITELLRKLNSVTPGAARLNEKHPLDGAE